MIGGIRDRAPRDVFRWMDIERPYRTRHRRASASALDPRWRGIPFGSSSARPRWPGDDRGCSTGRPPSTPIQTAGRPYWWSLDRIRSPARVPRHAFLGGPAPRRRDWRSRPARGRSCRRVRESPRMARGGAATRRSPARVGPHPRHPDPIDERLEASVGTDAVEHRLHAEGHEERGALLRRPLEP